jgi:hypothetical protein
MSADADERIARLYGLPPEEFTTERNSLATELRRQGERERADAVKRLRRPTAAAAAVNRLVRAEPDLVEALLGAGGELRQAHRQAASGRGAAQLRAAADAERAAVEALMSQAAQALGWVPGAALAEAMRNTLHAASSDDDARARVAAGTLERELRPVGLGPVPGGGQLGASVEREPPRKGSAKGSGRQSHRSAADATARRADERAVRQRAADHARELKTAAATEMALRRELAAAERALDRAENAYTRAREAAERAAERAKETRKRLREARAGLREAAARRARLERDAPNA